MVGCCLFCSCVGRLVWLVGRSVGFGVVAWLFVSLWVRLFVCLLAVLVVCVF